MSVKKSIFHYSLYQINQFLSTGISFIILTFSTRYLTTDEYGIVKNLQNLTNVLIIFFSFYISSAWIRFYYDYKNDREKLIKLTSTAFYFSVLLGILLIVPSCFAGRFYLEKIGVESNNFSFVLVFLIPIGCLFNSLSEIGVSYQQQERKNVSVNILRAINSILLLIITLLCLVGLGLKEISYFYASFGVSVLSFVFGFSVLIHNGLLKRVISFSLLKSILKLSIASVPLSCIGWIYLLSDQFILAIYGGVALSGKYALVYQLGIMISTVYQSFMKVLSPYLLSYFSEKTEDLRRHVVKLVNLGSFILVNSSLFLIFFGQKLLDLIAPDKFLLDPYILVVIVSSYVFMGVRKYTDNALFYKKRLIIMFITTGLIPATVNLVLNLIFIPIYFEYAAAFSTLVSSVLIAILSIIVNNRIYKIQHKSIVTNVLLFQFVFGVSVFVGLEMLKMASIINLITSFLLLVFSTIYILDKYINFKKLILNNFINKKNKI
jgi:O-antigen/teichoic acid export membrane protein